MVNCNPYEYYDGILGVQLCFLIKGSGEHQQSLSLIEYDALKKRIQKGSIIRLRANAPNIPALVRYDSLPQSWQDLLVRKFGEPRRMVRVQHHNLCHQIFKRQSLTKYICIFRKMLSDKK
jgi:hypothetical protein